MNEHPKFFFIVYVPASYHFGPDPRYFIKLKNKIHLGKLRLNVRLWYVYIDPTLKMYFVAYVCIIIRIVPK